MESPTNEASIGTWTIRLIVAAVVATPFLSFYAGFRDAQRQSVLFSGPARARVLPFIFAECETAQSCQFVYRVNNTNLLLVDFGKEKVREPEITVQQRLRAEDILVYKTFWSEQSMLVKGAESLGILKMVAETVKKTVPVEPVETKAKGIFKEYPARALAIVSALTAVSYGIGYFASEHVFPMGPGSTEFVAVAKANLANPEFQRQVLGQYVRIYSREQLNSWTADNFAPDDCLADSPARAYRSGFEAEEGFDGVAMSIPCDRSEFAAIVLMLSKRYNVVAKNGRSLRKIDVQMLAGIQKYASKQHRPQLDPKTSPSSGINWLSVVYAVGLLFALAALACVSYFGLIGASWLSKRLRTDS